MATEPAAAREPEPELGRRGVPLGNRLIAFVGLAAAGAILAVRFIGPLLPPPSQVPPGPSIGSSPGPGPVASAEASEPPFANPLPTPSTIDTVLLVGSTSALTAAEQQWLDDMRADLGRVDVLAYKDATAEIVTAYLTVFVIAQSPDLDVKALAAAYELGRTVHLAGPAAAYAGQVQAVTP